MTEVASTQRGRGGDRRPAELQRAEDARWNRIFEEKHGAEMAEYYRPRPLVMASSMTDVCTAVRYLYRS